MALPCVFIDMQLVTAVDEKAESHQHVACSLMTLFLHLPFARTMRTYERGKMHRIHNLVLCRVAQASSARVKKQA